LLQASGAATFIVVDDADGSMNVIAREPTPGVVPDAKRSMYVTVLPEAGSA
jgi:hypothetical protein